MNMYVQIIYEEIQRAENMLANYLGLAHGSIVLEGFNPSEIPNIGNDVKRIVQALQVLPVPAAPSHDLAARYMNLVDSLGVAVSKPRVQPIIHMALDVEEFLDSTWIVAFLRHAMMVALTFGAIQMPSAVAQTVALIAMFSAALAGGKLAKRAPAKGMAAGYLACIIGYAVGAALSGTGQAVMAGCAGVWAVTVVVAAMSIAAAILRPDTNHGPMTQVAHTSLSIGSYLNPLTHEYNSVDVGGSIRVI